MMISFALAAILTYAFLPSAITVVNITAQQEILANSETGEVSDCDLGGADNIVAPGTAPPKAASLRHLTMVKTSRSVKLLRSPWV